MPNFALNNTEFYDAPKNGGANIRMWLKYAEGGLKNFHNTNTHYYYLDYTPGENQDLSPPKSWVDNTTTFFIPTNTNNVKWCIVRDPIERFISAYTDKILFEQAATWSIDECIDLLESGKILELANSKNPSTVWPEQYIAYHLLGQNHWFGNSRDYFDFIFHLSEMDKVKQFCEDTIFNISLPNLHARNQSLSGIKKPKLSALQTTRLELVFAKDYKIGWY